ncbi:MAG TPA: ABC transporter transmembrane domain-containing protein, partial [Bacteriovoracaceae bacterium]|nr:ABC transporter transmembrane domain-containing protein [Bacteriovoracaceae bacterium]
CLLYYLGPSAILPLILFFSIFPLGRLYAKKFSRLQSAIQRNKDERLETFSSFLNDINAIKSFGWEDAVFNDIKKPRRREQFFWNRLIKLKALSTVNFLLINVMVAALAFGIYIYNGGVLTAELAFTCLCYFGFLEPSLKQISKISNDLAGALTANQRIKQLLSEVPKKVQIPYLQFLNHQSVAIVGRLGGGKSTLLNNLIPVFEEKVIGYQPQDPYLFESSLLENLTLGKSIKKEVINKSLDLTFLNTDLTFSERGLRTRLKVGGEGLSFAQKQKIVLARTYCLNPEVLLLDEPCSSFQKYKVDSIFENLLFGEWKHKKKIVVTSQVKHLPKFDMIVFIDSNRVLHQGTYNELLQNEEFYELVHYETEAKSEPISKDVQKYNFSEEEVNDSEEETYPEKVTPSLYLYYLRAMHAFQGRKRVVFTFSLLVLTALGVAFLPILQNIFIAKWTNVSGGYFWSLGYLGIGTVLAIVAGTQNFLWSAKTFKAATSLHDSVLTSVLSNYISFFDWYSETKLLNVFSKDLDTIEKDLTFSLEDAFISLLHTVTSIFVLIVTLPLICLVLVPIAFAFTKVIRLYRNNLCMLKNLIAEARVPRIRALGESIEGREVISAFNAQRYFLSRLNKGLDQYQDAISFQTVLSRWFVIKVSCLGSLISSSVIVYAYYSSSMGLMGKGLVSMMILYSFKFWENLCWSVKSVNEADSQMIFVKKFNELSRLEATPRILPKNANEDLVFENVIFSSAGDRFNSIDYLNEKVMTGEKVGIYSMSDVSRSAFLGMINGSKRLKSGRIKLGEVDFNDEIDRSKYISFVSDKSELFRGTVRSNLDPLDRKSEEEIREVLSFLNINLDLDQRVMSGGLNLSGGERKLMCLARALLADTKILVIEDSCPANVDLIYHFALKKTLEITSKTVLLISDEEKNLKECDRVFCIDHRVNHSTVVAA